MDVEVFVCSAGDGSLSPSGIHYAAALGMVDAANSGGFTALDEAANRCVPLLPVLLVRNITWTRRWVCLAWLPSRSGGDTTGTFHVHFGPPDSRRRGTLACILPIPCRHRCSLSILIGC